MGDHRVSFTLPVTELGRADATFQVRKNGRLLGTLHISHGALEYQPSGRMKKNSIRMDWQKFDQLVRESEL